MDLIGILSNAFKTQVLKSLGDVDDYSDKALEAKVNSFIEKGVEEQSLASDIDKESAIEELNAFLQSQKDGIKSDKAQENDNKDDIDKLGLKEVKTEFENFDGKSSDEINKIIGEIDTQIGINDNNKKIIDEALNQAKAELEDLKTQKTQEEEKKAQAEQEYAQAQKEYNEAENLFNNSLKDQDTISKEIEVENKNIEDKNQDKIDDALAQAKQEYNEEEDGSWQAFVNKAVQGVSLESSSIVSSLTSQLKSSESQEKDYQAIMGQQKNIMTQKQSEISACDAKIAQLDSAIEQKDVFINQLVDKQKECEETGNKLTTVKGEAKTAFEAAKKAEEEAARAAAAGGASGGGSGGYYASASDIFARAGNFSIDDKGRVWVTLDSGAKVGGYKASSGTPSTNRVYEQDGVGGANPATDGKGNYKATDLPAKP